MLIEQSIAKQYGVLPSEQGNLKYADWAKLVSGLMEDTPLGQMVQLRTEKDRDVLKRLTPEQRKLRADWALFKQQKYKDTAHKTDITALENMMKSLFGRKEASG